MNEPINEWARARMNQPLAQQANRYRHPDIKLPRVAKRTIETESPRGAFFCNLLRVKLKFERNQHMREKTNSAIPPIFSIDTITES